MIGTNESESVKTIAEARYLDKLNRTLDEDRVLIEKVLQKYKPYGVDDILRRMPPLYGDHIMPKGILMTKEGISRNKSQKEAGANNTREFLNRHYAVSGEMVRSKNEAILLNLYWAHGIRTEYEKRLILKNTSGMTVAVYPDITVDALDGGIMIHEHAGLLSDEKYCLSFAEKIGLYLNNGFRLWEDLFITADGPNGSIDTAAIDRMIKAFILPKALRIAR